jgi:peptidyl-dipeptidase A
MSLRHLATVVCATASVILTASSYAADTRGKEAAVRAFIDQYEKTVRPLEVEVARRWWQAAVTGADDDFKAKEEAENRLEAKLADAEAFARLKELKESGVGDPLLRRQIDLLYLQYLSRQIDPELIRAMLARSNAVEKAFANYRPTIDGKPATDNQVRRILRESNDSAERCRAWEASKAVAPVVEADLKELVGLRNRAARKLGFRNYHVMQLALAEQSQEQVLALFDELDELTRKPFAEAKAEIDAALAARCGIQASELRPWHYHDPFFQESPAVFAGTAKDVYRQIDIVRVCSEFYGGIGLPVDDVMRRSDLNERPGKNPHAFCIDIDRQGDVRILCNLVPGEEWFSTTLHELGHAVYSSKNIPGAMPYLLRTDAHALCTEGVAMMFERFVGNSKFLGDLGVKVDDAAAFDATTAKLRRNRLLIFSRWAQVMFRFEKALYENPEQDLNAVWWELVERYQGVGRPEGRNAPDYASKIHIATVPAYYHNYLMGELFASQVHHAICREVLSGVEPREASYVGDRRVGEFLVRRVFSPGRSLPWNELTRHATGEPLSAKAFAREIEAR